MKKVRKLLLASILFVGVFINAQVGINTENPTQTLDVKGTMRLKEPAEHRDGDFIFWNKDTGQWISRDLTKSDNGNVFHITYAIHLGQKGQDFANYVPLNINPDKYVAILTQSFLVKTKDGAEKGGEYYYSHSGTKSELPAYMRVPIVYDEKYDGKSPGDVDKIKFNNGNLKLDNGGNDNVPASGYLAIPQKDTRVQVYNNDYCFYGDYRDVTPYDESIKYTWVITVMVLNKNWVKEITN